MAIKYHNAYNLGFDNSMKDPMKRHLPATPAAQPKITHLEPLYPLKPLKLEQPIRRNGSYDFAKFPSRAGSTTHPYKPGK